MNSPHKNRSQNFTGKGWKWAGNGGIHRTKINTENDYRGSPALVAGQQYKGYHTSFLDLCYLACSTRFYKLLWDLTSHCTYDQGKHLPIQDKSAGEDASDSPGSSSKPPAEPPVQPWCSWPGCGGARTSTPAAHGEKEHSPTLSLNSTMGHTGEAGWGQLAR